MTDSVLAIDPGTTHSAIVWYKPGLAPDFGYGENAAIIRQLEEYSKDVPMAVEMIASYGMAVGKEVFETCVWIGRFVERRGGCFSAHKVYRGDVKMHLCRSMKANDSNIRQALMDIYGPGKEKAVGTKKAPGPLYGMSGDMWAALGVAVTYLADPGKYERF